MLIVDDLAALDNLDRADMGRIAGGLAAGTFGMSGLAASHAAADDPRLPALYIRPATLMERINCAEHGTKC